MKKDYLFLNRLVKSIMGDKAFELLSKAIVKQSSRSVVDITEMHDALQIAPKSVVAFLMLHLPQMKIGESKEIKVPWESETILLVNKTAEDVYKGHFQKNGKIEHQFDLCSIPQLAAHILSHFELYDEYLLDQKNKNSPEKPMPISGTTNEKKDDVFYQKLLLLENKINQIILLLAAQNNQAAPQINIELEKKEIEQNNHKAKKIKELVKLIRAVQVELSKSNGNTMPSPPSPGKHAGSTKGTTKSGLHGPKTPHSDFLSKPYRTQEDKNPYLKSGNKLAESFNLPKQPQPPKSNKMTFVLKSENESIKCPTCQHFVFEKGVFKKCLCFSVMSEPKVSKHKNIVTLFFDDDWSIDEKQALWHINNKNKK